MDEAPTLLGKALHRPVLSPDGRFLAVVTPDHGVDLIDLAEAVCGRKRITTVKIPQSIRPHLGEFDILRWSPEMILADEVDTPRPDFGRTWLLLSNGQRVVALSADLRTDDDDDGSTDILADYRLGGPSGKLRLLEFVLGHRHALAMFELAPTATILGLTRPRREEIGHVKYADSRSFAASPDGRYFGLLRREHGRDRVTVFEADGDDNVTYRSFDANTSDAQSLAWCPAGSPVIAVSDSPAYGVRVSFWTAQGHALKRWDVTSAAFHVTRSLDAQGAAEGVGVTHWRWIKAQDRQTLQIAADGQRRVLVRRRSPTSMTAQPLFVFSHPTVIDGSKTFVWQEAPTPAGGGSTFSRQGGAFEAGPTPAEGPRSSHSPTPSHVDLVEINADQTMIATRLSASPRTLFIWRRPDMIQDDLHPHTVVTLTHSVRQALWHPVLPDVLLILTAHHSPRLYAWCRETLAPVGGPAPIDPGSTCSAAWLAECARPDDRRCPLLLTTTTAFEVGHLGMVDGRIVFDGITSRPGLDGRDTASTAFDNDTTWEMDTPSRRPTSQPTPLTLKKGRFDMDPDPRTDRDDADPLHAQSQARREFLW